MKNQSQEYNTPIQLKMPADMERMIEIDDPVCSFNEVMRHIDLKRYFVEREHKTGRPPYDKEKLLKVVLFAFMEKTDMMCCGRSSSCVRQIFAFCGCRRMKKHPAI